MRSNHQESMCAPHKSHNVVILKLFFKLLKDKSVIYCGFETRISIAERRKIEWSDDEQRGGTKETFLGCDKLDKNRKSRSYFFNRK